MRRALAPMGSSAEQFAGCLHKCLGVEMHILHACRGLHVARRGSVELKLPMPGLDPCLASWLLAGRKRGVAACPCSPGLVINKRYHSPLGSNRASVRAALI